MKFSKSFFKSKPEGSLKYLLHKGLYRVSPARSINIVHASEVTKTTFCPRKYRLLDMMQKAPPAEVLTTSEVVTYQIGIDIQNHVVSWLSKVAKVYGNWICDYCGELHAFTQKPAKCTNCQSKALTYDEMRFTSNVSGISCGVDLVVDMGGTKLTIVEVKTIDKEKFKALAAPLAEHRVRTNLYMRIVDESVDPLAKQIGTKEAKVLYVSKGGYGVMDKGLKSNWALPEQFSPFKEYEVVRNDEATQTMTDLAHRLLEARSNSNLCDGICSSAMDSRAGKCPVRQECFS